MGRQMVYQGVLICLVLELSISYINGGHCSKHVTDKRHDQLSQVCSCSLMHADGENCEFNLNLIIKARGQQKTQLNVWHVPSDLLPWNCCTITLPLFGSLPLLCLLASPFAFTLDANCTRVHLRVKFVIEACLVHSRVQMSFHTS